MSEHSVIRRANIYAVGHLMETGPAGPSQPTTCCCLVRVRGGGRLCGVKAINIFIRFTGNVVTTAYAVHMSVLHFSLHLSVLLSHSFAVVV